MQHATIKLGGWNLNVIKLGGSFLFFAFLLKALEAIYLLLVTLEKLGVAGNDSNLVTQLLIGGWALGRGNTMTALDFLGNLFGPISGILFWLGLAVGSAIIYTSFMESSLKEKKK